MIKRIFRDKQNVHLFITIVIVSMIIHAPLFSKYILISDSLKYGFYYNHYQWELSLGRFGLYFMGLITHNLFIPHLNTILSIFMLPLIIILILKILDIQNKHFRYLISFMFIIMPHISYTLLYHYCCFSYLLAFFFSVFSVYYFLYEKSKIKRYIIPTILTALSLSLYQAYIQVSLTIVFLLLMKKLIKKEFHPRDFSYFIPYINGLFLYFIFMKLSLLIFHVSLANYRGFDQILRPDTILSLPQKIIYIYQIFFRFFFQDSFVKNTNVHQHFLYFLLLFFFLFMVIFCLFKNGGKKKEFIILILFLLFLPIVILFVGLFSSDFVSLLTCCAFFLLFVFPFSIIENYHKLIKGLFTLLVFLLCFCYLKQDIQSYQRLEKRNFIIYQLGKSISHHILQSDKVKKLMIVNGLNHNTYYNSHYNYNYSLYKDYGGMIDYNILGIDLNPNSNHLSPNIQKYLFLYFGIDIEYVDDDTYNQILHSNLLNNLPSYPDKNSIKVMDDVIIIKF